MKTMKKGISIFLSLLMVMSCFGGLSFTAGAAVVASGTFTNYSTSWSLDSNGTLKISGSGVMPNFSAQKNQPYYDYRNQIKRITVQSGVTTIGKYAFGGLNQVTTIDPLPSTITTIGERAFSGCSSVTGTLQIPNSVTRLYDYAFTGCSSLSGTLVIPDSVTSIGNWAFWNCSGFSGLVLSNNLTSLGENAFYECNGFTGDLILPNSLTTIPYRAFYNCYRFESLTLPESLTSIGNAAFYQLSGVTGTLSLPDTLRTIGDNAFCNCTGLTGPLVIPDSVTSIGSAAFSSCREITSLTIGNSVKTIGSGAFRGCYSLTGKLYIPESVTSIGKCAFHGCANRNDIYLFFEDYPNYITTVDSDNYIRIDCSDCGNMLQRLTINANNLSLDVGQTASIGATVEPSDLSNIPLTYEVEDGSVATVSENGTITGVSAGTTNVTVCMSTSPNVKKIILTNVEGSSNPATLVSSITVTPNPVEIEVGSTQQLTVAVEPSDAADQSVTYISDNTSVATVSETGLVTGIAEGTANITVTANDGSSVRTVVPVTVNAPRIISVEGITLSDDNFIVGVGESKTISFEYEPANASVTNVTVNTNNDCTATVDMTEKTITITGVSANLEIACYVVATDEEFVSVTNNFTVNVYDLSVPSDTTMLIGETYNVAATKQPVAAENPAYFYPISYSSSDTSVATVDTYGLVTAVAPGTTAITVTCGTVSKTVNIIVSGIVVNAEKIELGVDETFDAKTVIYSTSGENLTYSLWSSSGAAYDYATINNGVITGIAPNQSSLMLTVSCADNSASVTVPVYVYGKCGDTVYWKNDGNTLVIFGEGPMWDFDEDVHIKTYSYGNKNIEIQEGVTHIGNNAFRTNWKTGSYRVDYSAGTLGSTLTFPSSLRSIGNYAFFGAENYTGLVLNEGLESIGDYAFSGAGYNTSVIENHENDQFNEGVRRMSFTGNLIIPNSVKHIGSYAFRLCDGFTELTLGNSIEFIGEKAFASFSYVDKRGTAVHYYYNYSYSYPMNFANEITLPNTLTYLGDYAFEGCSSLIGDLVIPSSLTVLNDGIFAGAYSGNVSVGTLTIPNTITSIGNKAFLNCKFTNSLIIPNSVVSIGDEAFNQCSGFTGNLLIPNSVVSIGDEAFRMCTGFAGDLVIPDSVVTIGNGAFSSNRFDGELTIGNSVETIGNKAFFDCNGFTGNIEIPDSVTSIGDSAFASNSGFNGTLKLGSSLETIGSHAFEGCTRITGKLTIPESVTSIGDCAFHATATYNGDGSSPLNNYNGNYSDANVVKFFADYPEYIAYTTSSESGILTYKIRCTDCNQQIATVKAPLVTDFGVCIVDGDTKTEVPFETNSLFASTGIEQYSENFYYLTDSEGNRITVDTNPFAANSATSTYYNPNMGSTLTFATDDAENMFELTSAEITEFTVPLAYDAPYGIQKVGFGDQYLPVSYLFYSNGNIVYYNPLTEMGVAADGVTISMSTSGYVPVEVDRNGTQELAVVTAPENVDYESLIAVSADPTIASISDALVISGLKKGSTEITFTLTNVDGSTIVKTVPVNVGSNEVYVDSITVTNMNDDWMLLGSNKELDIEVAPANATDKGLTYTSSAPDIAYVKTVDEIGNPLEKPVLVANGLGQATITIASADDGEASTSFTITVVDFSMPDSITIRVGAIESYPATLTDGTNTLTPAASYQSTKTNYLQTANDGRIRGIAAGEADYIITLTDHPDISKTIRVNVVNNATGAQISQMIVPMSSAVNDDTNENLFNLCDSENVIWSFDSNPFTAAGTYTLKMDIPAYGVSNTINLSKNGESETYTYLGVMLEGPYLYTDGFAIGYSEGHVVALFEEAPPAGFEFELGVLKTKESAYVLNVGETSDFIASVLPAGASYTSAVLSIEEPTIASISDGTVTGLKAGTTNIIATITNTDGSIVTAVAPLTVLSTDVAVTGVTVDPDTMDLDIGETGQVTVTVAPDDATNPAVTYTSSDPTVATVSDTGLVTAIGEGTAVITVASEENPSITATVEVTVTDPFVPVSGLALSADSTTIPVGKTETLGIIITPANATDPQLSFESSNTEILDVDTHGVVTGISAGTATVTVKANDGSGKSATIDITVYDIKAKSKQIFDIATENNKIDASVDPTVAGIQLYYKSSDESIVKVEENGDLTLNNIGTATITVSDGPEGNATITKEISVYVINAYVYLTDLNYNYDYYTIGEHEFGAGVEPKNYTVNSFTISSSDPSVAESDNETKHVLTVKDEGKVGITAVIVVDVDGTEYTVTRTFDAVCRIPSSIDTGITNNNLVLAVGEVFTFDPIVTPVGLSYEIEPDDGGCFTVDGNNITGVSVGYGSFTVIPEYGDPVEIGVGVYKLTYDNKVVLAAGSDKAYLAYVEYAEPETLINTPFSYETADKTVADYKNGKINGIAPGKTIMTISTTDINDEPITREVEIIVVDASAVYGTDNQILKDQTIVPEITLSVPDDATGTIKSVSAVSSDPSVVAVGDNGAITGVGNGTATITLTIVAEVDGKEVPITKEIEVTAKVLAEGINISNINDPEYLEVDNTKQIEAGVTPDNTTNNTLAYASSKEAVATVNANGNITAVAPGEAVITVSTTDGSDISETINVVVYSVDYTEKLILEVGEEGTIEVTIDPANKLTYALSEFDNDNCITLTGNTVKADAAGDADVIITVNGKNYNVPVKTYSKDIGYDADAADALVGDKIDLTANITNGNVTKIEVLENTDPTVVQVDENGKVTVIGSGEATVTVKVTYEVGGETLTETVTQTFTGTTLVGEIEITNGEPIFLNVGENEDITADITPVDADNKALEYVSSDPTVASVDENGKITANGNGEATITVTAKDGSGESDTVKVIVYAISADYEKTVLCIDDVAELTTAVVPSDTLTIKTIKVDFSEDGILSVGDNGKLTALASGDVTVKLTIIAETADGEETPAVEKTFTFHVHNPGEPVHENDVRNDAANTYTFDLVTYCTNDHAELDRRTVILEIVPEEEAVPGKDGNIEYFVDKKDNDDPSDDDIYVWTVLNEETGDGEYELYDGDVITHVHNPGEPRHEDDKRDDVNGIYTFKLNIYCESEEPERLLESYTITLILTPADKATPGHDGNIEYFTFEGDPDDPDDDIIFVWDANEEKYVPYNGDLTTHEHLLGEPVHENDKRDDEHGVYTFELNTYCESEDPKPIIESETVILQIVPAVEAIPGRDGNIEYFVDDKDNDDPSDDDIYVWIVINEETGEGRYELYPDDVTTHVHNPAAPVQENVKLETETTPASFDLVVYCIDDHTEIERQYVELVMHPEKEANVNENGNVKYYTDGEGNKYIYDGETKKFVPVDNVETYVGTTYVPAKDAVDGEDGHDEYYLGEDGNKYVIDPETGLFVSVDDKDIVRHYPAQGVWENVTKKPTCVDTGIGDYVIYCKNCGEELSREIGAEIPATGVHTPGTAQKENIVPATCTSTGGYDLVVRCTVCGKILSSKHFESAKEPHTWGSDTITSGPYDKWTTGYHTCVVCGEREDFSYRNGNYQFRCSRCDWWDGVKNTGGILGAIYWMIHSITHLVQSIGHMT